MLHDGIRAQLLSLKNFDSAHSHSLTTHLNDFLSVRNSAKSRSHFTNLWDEFSPKALNKQPPNITTALAMKPKNPHQPQVLYCNGLPCGHWCLSPNITNHGTSNYGFISSHVWLAKPGRPIAEPPIFDDEAFVEANIFGYTNGETFPQ